MRRAFGLALLVLAGCRQAVEPLPEPAPPVAVAPGAITSAAELAGYYRVGGIEGVELGDEGFPVRITEDRVVVLAQCIKTQWSYRFEGARILVAIAEEREPCRRALNPDERAVAGAFDGMERAIRTPENGIRIEGSGPTLTLFSQ